MKSLDKMDRNAPFFAFERHFCPIIQWQIVEIDMERKSILQTGEIKNVQIHMKHLGVFGLRNHLILDEMVHHELIPQIW